MSITTELELRQFLSLNGISCHEIEFLTGGSANFSWRITSEQGNRSIIKHAEPFIRMNPDVPLPPERLHYEHLALVNVSSMSLGEEHVRLPQVHEYFQSEHLLYMSDGGTQDLRESYIAGSPIDVPLLGKRIGSWLAGLHQLTSEPETLGLMKDAFGKNDTEFVFQYPYSGLEPVLKHHGFDANLGTRIKAEFGSESDEDKICLCHGDFWLSNIQIEDQAKVVKKESEGHTKFLVPVLNVIDWENVRVGNGATDVGRFAADAWLTDRFHGDKGMFEAFLKAYLAKRPLNQRERTRLVVQFAVHIIFYSRMRWTDSDGTKELVRTGKEMLEAVEAEEWQSLKLGPLVQILNK